jgi:hypothetical protein
MTSIAAELGEGERVGCFRKRIAHAYARELGVRQRIVAPARLDLTPAAA